MMIIALKSMERVTGSVKKRVTMAPQNGDESPQNVFKVT